MKALNAIKEKVKTLNNKCHELADEMLAKASGGVLFLNRDQRTLPDASNPIVIEPEFPREDLPNQVVPGLKPTVAPHAHGVPGGIEPAEISKPQIRKYWSDKI